MIVDSKLATEDLEARLAEELEERTEFCDWLSLCITYCCGNGGGGTTSCTNTATCSVTSSTSTK